MAEIDLAEALKKISLRVNKWESDDVDRRNGVAVRCSRWWGRQRPVGLTLRCRRRRRFRPYVALKVCFNPSLGLDELRTMRQSKRKMKLVAAVSSAPSVLRTSGLACTAEDDDGDDERRVHGAFLLSYTADQLLPMRGYFTEDEFDLMLLPGFMARPVNLLTGTRSSPPPPLSFQTGLSVTEISAYFEEYLYLPRKMSYMAKSMYA